jgi:rhomboid protease GluP
MPILPKLWFQWQRIKKTFASSVGAEASAPKSTVRMCPHCRALIDRDAKVCPLCGEATGPLRARGSNSTPGRIMGVIPIPTTASAVVIAANLALYALCWYMTQNTEAAQFYGPPPMGGIDGNILMRLGAKAPQIIVEHQVWRLVTAMFLHAGLLHIGMNMWCLVDLGPQVESLFSTTKFTVFYLVTGVGGFLLSLAWSPGGVSVGASGAVVGLIGILIGASYHHGQLGRDIRNNLWKWVIYIAVLGMLGPSLGGGIDNAAHIGGLVCGLALGYFVPEGEPTTRPSENLWNALAVLSVLVIAGSFVLMTMHLPH